MLTDWTESDWGGIVWNCCYCCSYCCCWNILAAMSFSSDEVNFLVYRYLQESGFFHSAYTFGKSVFVPKPLAIFTSIGLYILCIVIQNIANMNHQYWPITIAIQFNFLYGSRIKEWERDYIVANTDSGRMSMSDFAAIYMHSFAANSSQFLFDSWTTLNIDHKIYLFWFNKDLFRDFDGL